MPAQAIKYVTIMIWNYTHHNSHVHLHASMSVPIPAARAFAFRFSASCSLAVRPVLALCFLSMRLFGQIGNYFRAVRHTHTRSKTDFYRATAQWIRHTSSRSHNRHKVKVRSNIVIRSARHECGWPHNTRHCRRRRRYIRHPDELDYAIQNKLTFSPARTSHGSPSTQSLTKDTGSGQHGKTTVDSVDNERKQKLHKTQIKKKTNKRLWQRHSHHWHLESCEKPNLHHRRLHDFCAYFMFAVIDRAQPFSVACELINQKRTSSVEAKKPIRQKVIPATGSKRMVLNKWILGTHRNCRVSLRCPLESNS